MPETGQILGGKVFSAKYLHSVKVNEVAYKRCPLLSATHSRFLLQRSTRSSAESSQSMNNCEDSNKAIGTVESATVAEKGRIPSRSPNAPNHTS